MAKVNATRTSKASNANIAAQEIDIIAVVFVGLDQDLDNLLCEFTGRIELGCDLGLFENFEEAIEDKDLEEFVIIGDCNEKGSEGTVEGERIYRKIDGLQI
jgi:hypothetical protein